MKKVSIIMPVYNGKEYISQSIESIINQSYDNWEFLIVNEFGSDDGSKEIIEKYAKEDSRIKLIQNNKREGISESLNIALRAATGEYIARMDSDDISCVDRLKKQVEFLDNNKDVDLCGIQPTFFGVNDMDWSVPLDSDYIKNGIFFFSPCVHPTIMFRSSLIKEHNILYNPKYRASEDYDFLSKVASVANITNINNPLLFKYRLHQTNATYTQNEVGLKNYSEIMQRLFREELDLNFEISEIELLNCHIGLNKFSGKELLDNYIKLDLLFKKILVKSYYSKKYDINTMFKVLKQRFNEVKWNISEKQKGDYKELIDQYLSVSIFNYETFNGKFVNNDEFDEKNIKVSIVLPVYNSEDYIIDSILSIINQDFKDYELLIGYEYGIKDQTLDYINIINDARIKIIKNEKKLGLAESLNVGIKAAKGKYIARLDSDDLSIDNRLQKQYDFLESHKNIDIVSSWQKHFGPNYIWIHKSPYEDKDIKAQLLFECVLCHSTVMFRKDKFIKNNLFYRTDIRQEDYELWCRACEHCNFAVLQEILGLYRLHDNNITGQDLSKVSESQCMIIKSNLEKLQIDTSKFRNEVLVGFEYLYDRIPGLDEEAYKLFDIILEKNKKYKIYNQDSLEEAINKRIKWIKQEANREVITPKKSYSFKQSIKKVLYPLYKKLKFRMIDIAQQEVAQNNYKFEELSSKLNSLEQKNNFLVQQQNNLEKRLNYLAPVYEKYTAKEKIRIIFIMQAASFWPSFESIYNELIYDNRFDFRLYVLDETEREKQQFESCKKFLKENNIKYYILTKAALEEFKPHIAFYQTPYDKWHRGEEYYSRELKQMGIRLIYIPYGIEFSNTKESVILQFGTEFINNMWRIYTINDELKKLYCMYSNLSAINVKALGNPKFDGLFNQFCLSNEEIKKKANGRKIVLVKIHFPKIFSDLGKEMLVTPDLNVYNELLENIEKYKDLYFVFMLHPKMFDSKYEGLNKLKNNLCSKNIYLFSHDDYRQALYDADFYIVDRSAVAIEMSALDKPILFMENEKYKERYIDCFAQLLSSYEKGTSYKDINKFLENCSNDKDVNRSIRQENFKKHIINYDGKIGKRIVDDIYNSINEETNE